ncbi:hypothetical protein [Klebsiella phage vB_KpnM-VAC36]|nr:hypothetical protein [Klebsiella phage vB_KpnM-VAC36]
MGNCLLDRQRSCYLDSGYHSGSYRCCFSHQMITLYGLFVGMVFSLVVITLIIDYTF